MTQNKEDFDLDDIDALIASADAKPVVGESYYAFNSDTLQKSSQLKIRITAVYAYEDLPDYIIDWIKAEAAERSWMISADQADIYYGIDTKDTTFDYWFVQETSGDWISLGTDTKLDLDGSLESMLDLYEDEYAKSSK